MLKFFRIPFALSGTRTPVPDAADPSGFVSYIEGYGPDYQRVKTDPLSKNIERDKMNEIFFDATTAIGEIQQQGIADFITTALNGGSPFSYALNALVRYSDGNLYKSIAASNTALPTDATKWTRVGYITAVATSEYPVFADALAAAANKTLIVNTTVTIAASVAIPSTVAVVVRKDGFFAVNAAQTLTINGSFTAGQYTVFGGAGSIVFGNLSRSPSPRIWFGTSGAPYDVQRTLLQTDGDTTGPVHAYEDNNILNMTHTIGASFNAYAGFDCQTQVTGAGAYDHHVSFQARPTYSGSGSIWVRWDGFNWLITHSGAGTVALARGVHLENPLGAGPITALYGVHVENLTRGGTNYGLFSQTPLNVLGVGAGVAATWLLRGNNQAGGFGLGIVSDTNSDGRVRNAANRPLYFGTNNVDTAVITADGRFKINTLTDLVGSGNIVDIVGTNGVVSKISSGLNPCHLNWSAAAAGDNVFHAFYTEASITQRGSIDYNRAGGLVRYNTTSDKTLKTRIGPAPMAKSLEILDGIVLEEYFWNDDPTEKPQIGPFAQDLQTVFRGAVTEGGWYDEEIGARTEQRLVSEATDDRPAEYETVEVEPARTERRYRPWAVDRTAPVWHLVAGYKALRAENAELKAQLADVITRLSSAGI